MGAKKAHHQDPLPRDVVAFHHLSEMTEMAIEPDHGEAMIGFAQFFDQGTVTALGCKAEIEIDAVAAAGEVIRVAGDR